MRPLPWVLFVTLCLSAGSVLAAPTWMVNSLNSIGCTASTTNFTTAVAGYTGGPERFRTQVDSGGLRYMDEDAGTPVGNQLYGWSLYSSSSGGPTSGTWPIPAGQPVTVNFMFINGSGGPIVYWRQVVLSKCDGGTIVSNQVYLDPSSASCVGLSDVPAGAGYCPSVQFLKNRAITLGCTSTTYCPNDAVTRAQMALFMNRLATALEPVFIRASQSSATAGVNANGVVCQTSSFIVGNAPRVATAAAMLYHTAATAQLVTARIVVSRDGGSTWENFSPFFTLASNVANGYVTQSPVANPKLFTVGQLVKFGIRAGEFGTPTVSVAGCNITVRIDNHNGTSFPYDAATETEPSTGAPNTGLPSDLKVPVPTPAPSTRSNNL